MVLTRYGWVTLASSLALLVVGRFLGALELVLIATAAATAVLAALLRALFVRVSISVERVISPANPSVGTPCEVTLSIRNHRRRRTPPLLLIDPVGKRFATIAVPQIAPGATIYPTYDLPTARRGKLKVGPLQAFLEDPLGLTRIIVAETPHVDLTVYPRVYPLAHIPPNIGRNPDAADKSRHAIGLQGDEFFALRPFQVGDELRHVHWPASARFDELVVRQTNIPAAGQLTVLLDTRGSVHSEDSFDIAVSAAASIFSLATRTGLLFRLIATDGVDSGVTSGFGAYSTFLEYLAAVSLTANTSITSTVELLAASPRGGSLIIVTGAAGSHDRKRFDLANRAFLSATTVVVPHFEEGQTPGTTSFYFRPDDIVVSPTLRFPQAWAARMSQHSRRKPSTSR